MTSITLRLLKKSGDIVRQKFCFFFLTVFFFFLPGGNAFLNSSAKSSLEIEQILFLLKRFPGNACAASRTSLFEVIEVLLHNVSFAGKFSKLQLPKILSWTPIRIALVVFLFAATVLCRKAHPRGPLIKNCLRKSASRFI